MDLNPLINDLISYDRSYESPICECMSGFFVASAVDRVRVLPGLESR